MRRKASWWVAAAILAACYLIAASSVNDVGGRNMFVYRIPAGVDSILVDSTDLDTDGNGECDFSKVTKIGLKYDAASTGIDSLSIHLRRGWRTMPYPRGSVDVFEIQLADMSEIHAGTTPAGAAYKGQVLRVDNNSAGNLWVYVWGD
jgi:hypothetical protein